MKLLLIAILLLSGCATTPPPAMVYAAHKGMVWREKGYELK